MSEKIIPQPLALRPAAPCLVLAGDLTNVGGNTLQSQQPGGASGDGEPRPPDSVGGEAGLVAQAKTQLAAALIPERRGGDEHGGGRLLSGGSIHGPTAIAGSTVDGLGDFVAGL